MSTAPEPPVEPERDGQTTDPSGAGSPDAEWRIPPRGFDSYREAAVHLRRPFTPEAVRFKVQATFGPKEKEKPRTGALIVAYIDARLVVERLNLCAPHLWSETYQGTSQPNFLLCRLTVDGITREDVGESPKGFSKDLVSDALKRAAVHFGIGVSLYALPQANLYEEHIKNKNLKPTTKDGKASLALTDKGDRALRARYEKWLTAYGIRSFGPPLEHGDQEGHLDAPEASAPEPEPEPDPQAEAEADATVAAYQQRLREEAAA